MKYGGPCVEPAAFRADSQGLESLALGSETCSRWVHGKRCPSASSKSLEKTAASLQMRSLATVSRGPMPIDTDIAERPPRSLGWACCRTSVEAIGAAISASLGGSTGGQTALQRWLRFQTAWRVK